MRTFFNVSKKQEKILEVLAGGRELYASEIASGSKGVIDQKGSYPHLNSLIDKGYLSMREHGLTSDGKIRKIYRLTADGERAYRALQTAKKILNGKQPKSFPKRAK